MRSYHWKIEPIKNVHEPTKLAIVEVFISSIKRAKPVSAKPMEPTELQNAACQEAETERTRLEGNGP